MEIAGEPMHLMVAHVRPGALLEVYVFAWFCETQPIPFDVHAHIRRQGYADARYLDL